MTRLSFDTLCETALPTGNPPSIALALRGDGWARLALGGAPDGIEVSLSNLYPPFFDLYAWLMAIAFDLGPVAVAIDEEGPCTHLYAAPGQDGEAWTFAVVQRAWDGAVIAALAWREARAAWVARFGQAFARLFDDFDEAAWIPGPAQWPEAASALDWQLPARLRLPAVAT